MKKAVSAAGVMFLFCVVYFCSLVGAGDLNPPGPPGGTMKPLDQVEPRIAVQTLPGNTNSTYVISQSGSYYLTGNLTASLNKHAIEITADHVTLDLCGFTINGGPVLMEEIRHGITMSGRTNVEIRNGTIRNCKGHGICESSTDGRGHRVLGIRAQDQILYGLRLKGKGHLVKDCTAIDNGGPGIHAGFPSTVKDNHQSANGDNMLPVEGGAFAYQNVSSTLEWVYVPDFYVAKFETTNTEYCEFLDEVDVRGQYFDSQMEIIQSGSAGQYTYTVQSGKEEYPIRFVSAYDAQAYARWKSRVTGLNYRLPSEQEWEKAAGWDPVLQELWTYGFQQDTIDATWCNYNDYYSGTLPVGTFNGGGITHDAKSYYGCYDMSGNVWEWTLALWEPNSAYGVVRSGYWSGSAVYCAVTYRSASVPSGRGPGGGFRLARDFE